MDLENIILALMLMIVVIFTSLILHSCAKKEFNSKCFEQTKDARCWELK